MGLGDHSIDLDGADWLQLRFSEFSLRRNAKFTIINSAYNEQSFTAVQLEEWGGVTAILNGDNIRTSVFLGTDIRASVTIGKITIGLKKCDYDGSN